MRKIIFVFSLLAISLKGQASGYYESYSDNNMSGLESWTLFFGILFVVWGILQIILFFKIWGMTNDIRELKEDHFATGRIDNLNQLRAYLRENIVLDKKENVRNALLNDFLDQINNKCNPYRSSYIPAQDPVMNTDITPYVNLLIMQLAKVGMEAPEAVLKMKTYRDYYEYYTKEDFIAEEG